MEIEALLLCVTKCYDKKAEPKLKCERGDNGSFNVIVTGNHATLYSLAIHMRFQGIEGVRVAPSMGVRTELKVRLADDKASEKKLINCCIAILEDRLAPQAGALFKRARKLIERSIMEPHIPKSEVLKQIMLRAVTKQLDRE